MVLNTDRTTVLVAGSTGYVGQRLVAELAARGAYDVRALVRQTGRLSDAQNSLCTEFVGDVLDAASLQPACRGCDAVVSCVGSSMLAPGSVQNVFRPTAEGNLALFKAARAAGAKRFVMIASCNSEARREEFEGFRVREAAIDCIKHLAELDSRDPDGAGISYTVIGPSGFFKDYDRIFRTVQRKGRASSLGNGFNMRSNPIHPEDLASRIADSLERSEDENQRIEVGGPDVYTFRQIALLAANAAGVRRIRYKSVPIWAVQLMMAFLRLLSWVWAGAMRYHAFAEFLVVISSHDSVGECYGSRHLADHFKQLAAQSDSRQ